MISGLQIASANGLTPFPPGASLAPPGLVSWWPAEGNANDAVGTNHGTLVNNASFGAGMVGQSFVFDGNYQCARIPYATTLVPSTYSVETWVKPMAQVSDPIGQEFIFGQGYGWCQLVARTGSTGVRVAFQFGASHTSFYEVASATEIPIGQFSHLAGTWDGSTLRLYINGVLDAQSTPGASPSDSGCAFWIGGCYSPSEGACSYVGQFFSGLIDEIGYFNRALSAAEIQSIHAAASSGKCLVVAPLVITQPGDQSRASGQQRNLHRYRQ